MSLDPMHFVKGRMEITVTPTDDNFFCVFGRRFKGKCTIIKLGHKDKIYNSPQAARFFIKIFNRGWKEDL